jgi:hypothetical protein
LPANVNYTMNLRQPSTQLFFHGRNRNGHHIPGCLQAVQQLDSQRLPRIGQHRQMVCIQ